MKSDKFGMVFRMKDPKTLQDVDLWQPNNVRVARVDQVYPEDPKDQSSRPLTRPTIASNFPVIRAGSRLTGINGCAPPPTFKEALPLLKQKPLVLEFNGTVAQTQLKLPKWLLAGLAEVQLVRRHEASKVPAHADLSCPSCPHKKLVRNLSPGWKTLANHSPKDRQHALQRQAERAEEQTAAQKGPAAELDVAKKQAARLRTELSQLQEEMAEKQRELWDKEAEIQSLATGQEDAQWRSIRGLQCVLNTCSTVLSEQHVTTNQ